MSKHHCEAAIDAPATGHCDDHSGQLMWMKGIGILLTFAVGLLSYSVFWQAPAIKTEIAKEVARVDGEIKLVKRDVEELRSSLTDLKGRVDKLD